MRQGPQLLQLLMEYPTHPGSPLDQPVLREIAQRCRASGAEHGMVRKRLRVDQPSGAVGEDAGDPVSGHHGRDGRVTTPDSLPQRHEVGRHPELLAERQRAGSAGAGKHLVSHEEHVIAVADGADPLEVASRWYRATGGGPADRLHDEGRHQRRGDP